MADAMPTYLTGETEETIRARMLAALPGDLDKTEGSYLWDAISPAAIELAQAAIWAQEVLRRGFASTTYGNYLDLRCAEHGVTRLAAVKATGKVTLTGTAGKVVTAGITVATPADPSTGASSVLFVTTSGTILESNGKGIVDIEAVEGGSNTNVPAQSINILVDPVADLTGVINEQATSGGLDTETDAALLTRYLLKVRFPSTGGNKADYVNWAMEVPGVGGVSVIPISAGPGTVSVAIVDLDKAPAPQSLVDDVYDYIAPPHVLEKEAEAMAMGGQGVTVDQTQSDDIGASIKMVYNAGGNGLLSYPLDDQFLPQPGIWQARIKVKVSATGGTGQLLELGIRNNSNPGWCKTTATGNVDAMDTFSGNELTVSFKDYIIEFYWNGQDHIQFQATRRNTETATTVWIDRVVFRSMFSKDTGEGKAPVGATVTIKPATAVTIHVDANWNLIAGYNPGLVKSAVEANIRSYLKSLVFTANNDVLCAKIGEIILNTPGVYYYQNLSVNDVANQNVLIGEQEIAVLGEVTLTL